MTPKMVIRKLKQIDGRTRVCWSNGKVSGIYFKQPDHPDAHENGLRHIGAIASPYWFTTLPERDFFTHPAKEGWYTAPEIKEYGDKWEYHRGWQTTLKHLVHAGHFTKEAITKHFGSGWQGVGLHDKESALPGWGAPTRLERITKELGLVATH